MLLVQAAARQGQGSFGFDFAGRVVFHVNFLVATLNRNNCKQLVFWGGIGILNTLLVASYKAC